MALLMPVEADPKDELLQGVGDLGEIEIFHNQIICAVYIRPEKTRGGIILTDTTRGEDRFQSKVGLIVKMGDKAFLGDADWSWPEPPKVGDWVVFRASDGWNITVGGSQGQLCRVLTDTAVRMRINHPDQIW